jgi:hypothetical protein
MVKKRTRPSPNGPPTLLSSSQRRVAGDQVRPPSRASGPGEPLPAAPGFDGRLGASAAVAAPRVVVSYATVLSGRSGWLYLLPGNARALAAWRLRLAGQTRMAPAGPFGLRHPGRHGS